MKALLKKLTNQEIKEQMFKMAKGHDNQMAYGFLFDELESRLSEEDFDDFLDQIDKLMLDTGERK